MHSDLAIVADPRAMTITVGEKVFDRPHLIHRPEVDFSIKAEVCPDTNEYAVEKLHKFYCSRLGPKFNRRFQAANYWLWLGGRMDRGTENSLRHPGRNWRYYNDDLVLSASKALPYVNEAERDGLHHLVPAIVIFQASPSSIRKEVGGASWRRIAHNSKTRNQRIMQVCGIRGLSRELFVRLLDFPSGVLGGVETGDADEVIAARLTPRKNAIAFRQTTSIVRDTRRMRGEVNPNWSLARMRREHEEASREVRKGKFSAKTFAEPWSFSEGGFTAELLTSALDVAVEGDTQHHCVASYAGMCASQSYAVLRIDGKERATAGLHKMGKAWRVDQVYGACNMIVSEECNSFAIKAAVALAKRPLARIAA